MLFGVCAYVVCLCPLFSGIIAEVRSGDTRLKDAVGKNDSSLLSTESLQLLHTTLHNWGNTLRHLGSKGQNDDDDDSDDSSGPANVTNGNGDKTARATGNGKDTTGDNSGGGPKDGGDGQEDKNELQVGVALQ